jgi:hypothetical protein
MADQMDTPPSVRHLDELLRDCPPTIPIRSNPSRGRCDYGVGNLVIGPFTGLSPQRPNELIALVVDPVRRADCGAAGRPGLLVAACWRTNLHPAALVPVSKSTADRSLGHLGAPLALQKDGSVWSPC